MVTVGIVAKSEEKVEFLKDLLLQHHLTYTQKNPDIVLSYGGDGMFLYAERLFPGIPKVLLRDSAICNHCINLEKDEILARINRGEYATRDIPKLYAHETTEKKSLVGVNDIVIRNLLPTEAVRFQYTINDGDFSEEIIGDGIVVATPFGSSPGAYYHTISHETFFTGYGVAFNNTSKKRKPLHLAEGDVLKIHISRGYGVLVADNNRNFIHLKDSDTVTIKLDSSCATLVTFD